MLSDVNILRLELNGTVTRGLNT